MSTGPDDRPARAAFPWVPVLALLLVALNLRAPFVGVSVVTDELRSALDASSGEIGLLTSLPVLCFGLAAPLALAVVRRLGAEVAVVVCLAGVVLGSLVRSSGSLAAAAVGTVVLGLGITIGNIVVPVLIRRSTPPAYVGAVTGAYTATLNIGSMCVLVGTAPLADAAGWQVAIVAPAVAASLAIALWWRVALPRGLPVAGGVAEEAGPGVSVVPATGGTRARPLWREPVVLLLALAFAGQATSYYSLTAWLPSVLADEAGAGDAAGGLAAVFQIAAIIGAVGVPLLALRVPEWCTVALVGVLWTSFPVQLLVAPDAYLLGSLLGGAAQGGGFAAIFTIIARVARSDRESAGMSTFVQTVGYAVAAVGPTLLGAVHDATGSWTVPLALVVGTTATFTVAGSAAALNARRR
ncbi:CynX/NimT family MFS transporter [Nocardioides sp. CPCC 205120]|uniref:MFS transporter n=1 Tax=Nocardioides sp. CPCC 205120 TaxID=3406462 RepID=UPI003B50D53B